MKYEYICTNCKDEFTHEQSMKDDFLTYCIKCKSESVTRLIKPANFHLKGSGWTSKEIRSNSLR